jgi:hypothetical protein
MSTDALRCEARLTPAIAGPCVRVALTLAVRNEGLDIAYVPHPYRGGRHLALHLAWPSGRRQTLVVGEQPPMAGRVEIPVNRAVPPGTSVVFESELAWHFDTSQSGRYTLQVEYTLSEGTTWRSPMLEFERAQAAGSFLDVVPIESAAIGYHSVIWLERGQNGTHVLLFDDDGRAPYIANASIVADDLPAGAEIALSQYPAGLPFSEHWFAWIASGQLGVRFYAHGDPELSIDGPRFSFPAGTVEPRFVRPLLADQAPDDGRPGCTIGLLAGDRDDNRALHVIRLAPDGDISATAVASVPGVPIAAWAIAPSAGERYFVLALATAAAVRLVAYPSNPRTLLGAIRHWHTEADSGFRAGDVRATLAGRTLVGLVLSAGTVWVRLTFTVPNAHRTMIENVTREQVSIPPGAKAMRPRLDTTGRLHLLYASPRTPDDSAAPPGVSSDTMLRYLTPSATQACWSSDHLGTVDPSNAHLILRPDSRAVLIAYDSGTGPFLQRI